MHNTHTGWDKFKTTYGLWNPKRHEMMKALLEQVPSSAFFDSRMAAYDGVVTKVESMNNPRVVGFLLFDCQAVVHKISQEALQWKTDYGNVLNTIAQTALEKFEDNAHKMRLEIDNEPNDINMMKFVLSAIGRVEGCDMDMQLRAREIAEQYETLRLWEYPLEDDMYSNAISLLEKWALLLNHAKSKDLRMMKVKEDYKRRTYEKTAEFKLHVKTLLKNFETNGPTSMNVNLTEGSKKLLQFNDDLDNAKQQRVDLVEEQKLFKIDVPEYPELTKLAHEMTRINKVFDLYNLFLDFEESQGTQQWAALDITGLTEGIAKLIKTMNKYPKPLKEMPLFGMVKAKITGFKESIPLIESLKNDSMMPRHWKKLGTKTGVKIDAGDPTFTLRSIFEMDLSRFDEEISEIVGEAMQEMKLQVALTNLKSLWRTKKFVLVKYKKGDQVQPYYAATTPLCFHFYMCRYVVLFWVQRMRSSWTSRTIYSCYKRCLETVSWEYFWTR